MSRKTRLILGGATLWLIVVGIGSTIAWLAIDRAGGPVRSADPLVMDQRGTSSPSSPDIPTPSTSSLTQSAPAGTPPPSSVPPPPPPKFRTWTGSAGSVTVSCDGTRGRLVSATPTNDWRAEGRESGDRVRVNFERGELEVEVESECSSSGPLFTVDSRGEDEFEDD